MSTHEDDRDLDLLLSLRVPETPPESPDHSHFPGYLSDDGSPGRTKSGAADMSVFRDAVRDYLASDPGGILGATDTGTGKPRSSRTKGSSDVEVEKFSGLRIRKPLMSQAEISGHFADVRFVRLSAIRNSMVVDNISGCWATVGVLTEKGHPKVSSNGRSFCVWKLGSLDETTISVFLFGDAYSSKSHEPVGTIFALFNSSVRKDTSGSGYSLSVYSDGQILKMGTSADYDVCKGKRKDGIACTMVINRRQGMYCRYHTSKASEKYSTSRTELKGGNLRTAFRSHREGVYMVDPLRNKSNSAKPVQAVKVMSVDGLKKALSKADNVTTNRQSQGIRFLTEVAAKLEPNKFVKGSTKLSQMKSSTVKRSFSTVKQAPSVVAASYLPDAKRKKIHGTMKVIELDTCTSSDDEK